MNTDKTGLMMNMEINWIVLEEWRGSIFFGLGASLQKSVYYNTQTGEIKEMWTGGVGGGLPGGSLTYTPTGGKLSTSDMPSDGISIETRAKAGVITDFGAQSKIDLNNKEVTLGTTNIQVSSRGSLTAGAAYGVSSEASGTLNFSVRKGAYEDWFYDNFTKKYTNWKYGSTIEENNRWLTENQARQQSWNKFVNYVNRMGRLPSDQK